MNVPPAISWVMNRCDRIIHEVPNSAVRLLIKNVLYWTSKSMPTLELTRRWKVARSERTRSGWVQ